MTKWRQKAPITAEKFDFIVGKLEKRALRYLNKQARVGHSSRATGKSRISDAELNGRLARLRDHTHSNVSKARRFFADYEQIGDDTCLFAQLEIAEKSIKYEHFSGRHWGKLFRRLLMLQEAVQNVLDLITPLIASYGSQIAEGQPLHLLTPDEVETAFEDVPEAVPLAELLRIDLAMRAVDDEVMALLKGRIYEVVRGKGGLERRRGRWITAHLLGLAEGYGLKATRNHSPNQHAALQSAADAVAITIARLHARVLNCTENSEDVDIWLTDPTARAVLREMPTTTLNEHSNKAVADNIIRKLVPSGEDYILQARRVGRSIGERKSKI